MSKNYCGVSVAKVGFVAIALAMGLTACGEDGKNGVDGAPGEQGAVGEPGESCSAKPLADDSGYTLTCGDKDVGVIRNGVNGVNGKDGAGCMAEPMANGDYKVFCGGVVVGVLFNGNGGSNGQGETGGTSCSAKALADGSGYTLTCGGVDVGTISNGRDGYSCRASQNADKTVTTITCETADGDVSYEVANGKSTYEIAVEAGFQGSEAEWLESLKGDKGGDGVGCEVSRNGYELTITCANSKEVVDLRDFIMQSSTSETNSSSSESDESSSPSVTPDPVPGSNSSSSESDEGSSPSVTPDPVPGSNSSSSEEDVAAVKPDGYYSNSSNCPAGLDCKYATTTEYLNPTKTYGEILDTRDGLVYKTIKICDDKNENCQTWMAQNLNYGDVKSWCGGGSGKTEGDCSKYGRLYTWKVAMDKAGCGYGTYCNNSYEGTQGVCPAGWHLPTKEEWQQLVKPMATSVDDYTTDWTYNGAGVELKTVDGWSYYSSSTAGTNASGFSALPAGSRFDDGYFSSAGADFWSASELNGSSAYHLYLNYHSDYAGLGDVDKLDANSVRCVQNN